MTQIIRSFCEISQHIQIKFLCGSTTWALQDYDFNVWYLDEEARKNWEKYGHPDGKQAVDIGLALPKILMGNDGNGPLVLAVLVILGIVLPLGVAAWFLFSSSKFSGPNQVMAETLHMFVRWQPWPIYKYCSQRSGTTIILLSRKICQTLDAYIPFDHLRVWGKFCKKDFNMGYHEDLHPDVSGILAI